jgi:hypothetical protein
MKPQRIPSAYDQRWMAEFSREIEAALAKGDAVPDATGGITVDTEARAAINALLARLRTIGLIDGN